MDKKTVTITLQGHVPSDMTIHEEYFHVALFKTSIEPEFAKWCEQTAALTGKDCTANDIVANAIRLYAIYLDLCSKGSRVRVTNATGEEHDLTLLFRPE